MNTEQAKRIFNDAIAKQTDADKVARLELVREYFTNPEFRTALHDHVWAINQQHG